MTRSPRPRRRAVPPGSSGAAESTLPFLPNRSISRCMRAYERRFWNSRMPSGCFA